MSRKNPVFVTDETIIDLVTRHSNPTTGVKVADLVKLTGGSETSLSNKVLNLVNTKKLRRESKGKGYEYFLNVISASKEPAHEEIISKVIITPHPIQKIENPLDIMIDNLAYQIADAIITKVRSKLYRDIPELKPTIDLPSNEEVLARLKKPEETKVKKLRVLVLNLLPQQAGLIQSELYDCLDIDFWNDRTGDGIEKLKALAKWSDMVFIHTKHASHNHQEVVKSVGAPFTLVPGGISQMQEALTKFFIEGKEA